MTRHKTDRGLTLIELVVAMSVFALVAIMGLQSLSGSLGQRDRLTARADQTDALGQGLALMRNDLSAALPMFFFPPRQGAPASAIRGARGGQGFGLSLGGQPGLTLQGGGVDATQKQRVDWQFDAARQQLTRAVWPTLYPVDAAQQGPQVPVLDGVTGFGLRSYWVGQGWVDGLRPPQGGQGVASAASGDDDKVGEAAPEIYSNTLPRAVEITLETRDFGQIVLLEYFQ